MKILIAGLGSIGQRHARNLRTLLGDEVELLAYRVRGLPHVITEQMTIEPGTTVEDRYRIRSFTCLDAALSERPDATLVCNPSSLHAATAAAALRAGSHVLIEKPLAGSIDGVAELLALSTSASLVATVGFQLRFHPALVRMRELLRQNAIGAVRSVRADWHEYLPDAHPYEDYRELYAARRDLGGGVILCYIHEFDYLAWLFGMPRRVSTTGGRLGHLEIDVEDTAATVMECQVNGAPVQIELHQSFSQTARSRTCEVLGETGTIHLDLLAPSLMVTDARGEVIEQQAFDAFDRNQLFLGELNHFLEAAAGVHPPAVPLMEAAKSLRVALAARESLATGAHGGGLIVSRCPEVLASIPARGGSKGIPRKNLLMLAGKPLIAHSIAQALASQHITRTIVSTDDEEIAEVARAHGAEVPFMRPAEFAQDGSTDLDVFRHALTTLRDRDGYACDCVVHLRPTGPVRRAARIDEAIGMLLAAPDADSLRSVTWPLQTPYKMWRVTNGLLEPLLRIDGVDEPSCQPRQSLPEVFWQNGYVDIVRPRVILEDGRMCGTRIVPFVMREPVFELDYPESIPVVEAALRALQDGSGRDDAGAEVRHPV